MAKQLQAGGQRAGRAGKGTSHLHARRQRAVHASRHLIIKRMPLSTADKETPQQMQDIVCRCDRPEGSKAALASKPASLSARPGAARCSSTLQHTHRLAPPYLCSEVLWQPSMARCSCSRQRHTRCASSKCSSPSLPDASSCGEAHMGWGGQQRSVWVDWEVLEAVHPMIPLPHSKMDTPPLCKTAERHRLQHTQPAALA